MGETARFAYLDGIRAVAIAAVLALHWVSWYVPLFHGGSIGVDVFFVLSGFIITTLLWRPEQAGYRAFVHRRVLRLYPALVGLVAGSVVLYAAVPWAPAGPVEVARRGVLVLSQASSVWAAGQSGSLWLPGLQPFGQTWSLAVEWYFYLLWPLLVLLARRRGWSAARLARLTAVAAVALYLMALPLPTFPFYFGPLARFAELLAGGALALHLSAGARPTSRGGLPASVALAAIAAYALLGADGHSPVYGFVGIPVGVAATLVLVHHGYAGGAGPTRSPVHRLLSHPAVAAVGRCSYSLYLWHVVPFLLLEDAPAPRLVLGPIAVAAAVGLTWLSFRWLERPFLRGRSDALRPAAAGLTSGSRAVAPRPRPAR